MEYLLIILTAATGAIHTQILPNSQACTDARRVVLLTAIEHDLEVVCMEFKNTVYRVNYEPMEK